MEPRYIVAVGLYLVLLSILVLYGLLKIWPYPTPSGEPKDTIQTQADTSQASNTVASPTASPSPTAQASPTATQGQTTPTPVVAAAAQGGAPPAAALTPAQTPPTPTPKPTPAPKSIQDPEVIHFFGGYFKPTVYLETRLLLLVMLAGALGSLMHALRSLYWYTGNREMVWSWVAFYLLLPFTGAMLAVIFYLVVRGGFFSPQASTETTSPFGFAALSALVGLFSQPATLKLKDIAETIFTKPAPGADTKPQPTEKDEAATPAPTVTLIAPASGSAAGEEKVVITGTDFSTDVKVEIGGVPAEVTSSTSTTIEATTPKSATGPGVVDVKVTNSDGTNVTLAQGYTYAVADSDAGGAAADELDGHEAVEADTADEDLPITEGGVE